MFVKSDALSTDAFCRLETAMRTPGTHWLTVLLVFGAVAGSGQLGWHRGATTTSIEGPVTAEHVSWLLPLRR